MTKAHSIHRALRSPIVRLVLLAIVARLLFIAAVHPWTMTTSEQLNLNNDSPGYHDLAVTLLEHGKFARGIDHELDALRTPGYVLFVAGVYAVAGPRPWAVMLVQLLLDALACVLLFVTVRRVIDERVASWAAVFYALDPHLLLYGTLLLSDTLYVFALALLFWQGVRTSESGFRISQTLVLGLVLGFATLIRPVSQYLWLFMCGWLLWTLRRELGRALASAAVLALAFLLALSPWLMRNNQQFGHFSISTSGSYNLLVLNVAPVVAEQRRLAPDVARRTLLAEADSLCVSDGKNPSELNAFDLSVYWKKLAVNYVKQDPLPYVFAWTKGAMFTFLNAGSSDFMNSFGLEAASLKNYHGITAKARAFFREKSAAEFSTVFLILIYLALSYYFVFRGLWVSPMMSNRTALMFCVVVGAYFILIVGAGGLARFRLPVLIFYLPFLGLGIEEWLRARRQSKQKA